VCDDIGAGGFGSFLTFIGCSQGTKDDRSSDMERVFRGRYDMMLSDTGTTLGG
jgi:hypothetical protein